MTPRIRLALAGAATAAILLALTWILALHVGLFERADQAVFDGFFGLHTHPQLARVANAIAGLCDPSPYVYLAVVPVLGALLRRRPRVVLAIGCILLCANVTTQLLKPLLAQPRAHWLVSGTQVDAASWPSGHATAAMSLALCCVLAAPARLRAAVATVGAAFAVAVSFSFLSLGWHYPSDVFGGFLVATTWTMLAVAGVYASNVRWPPAVAGERPARVSPWEAVAPQLALVFGALVLVGLVALAHPHEVVIYARGHKTFIFGAAAIGVAAMAVASAITLAINRPAPAGSGPAPTAAPRRRWRPDSG